MVPLGAASLLSRCRIAANAVLKGDDCNGVMFTSHNVFQPHIDKRTFGNVKQLEALWKLVCLRGARGLCLNHRLSRIL